MRIYVTGLSGFIGSAFCNLARSRGHDVRGLSGNERLENPPWDAIKSFAPEACLHTAWITEPGQYLTSESNRDYARWSVEFLREMCAIGVAHVVGLGTCIEYAPSAAPMNETSSVVAPISLYARSKNDVRVSLEELSARHACKFAWARVFYPYGPGEHPRRLSSSIIASLKADRRVTLNTPQSVKDYIYIEDVASALLTIIEARFGGVINVGTGVGHSILEVAETIARQLGKTDLINEARPPAADDYPFAVADSTRLRQLGWAPQFDLSAGVDRLIASIC